MGKLRKFFKNNFGVSAVDSLGNVGLGVVFVAIILAVGAMILGSMSGTMMDDSYEKNITTDGLNAIDTISGNWLSIVVVVAIAAVLIFMVSRFRQEA